MDIDDILADLDAATVPQETLDIQLLTRLWVAERVAPELLVWPDDLISRITERMSAQVELIEEQTATMDPKSSFGLIVLQTEMERVKFLVRSYLRARLAKVDAHPLYYNEGEPAGRLSVEEKQYLTAHQTLLEAHYGASFLGQFPAQLQRMDDPAGGISMVETPDAERAVFVRALRDAGLVRMPGRDESWDVKRGDVRVVRWSAVRDLVEIGDLELI
ncbi:DNA replication complex GINS protein SLD5 [Microthyrium microscopicum]|uniref:DNA replication complex GINS protein SLD5 n=1 Tax=Microthyrium microscopicum TaxID=703497 RepID=A0A6A6U0W3_9PEZI|nr:DNA replication complex GINS protein SLD5 [Microthyrium microscopicum]